VDAYGRDLPGMAEDDSGRRAHTFTDLLRHVHDVPGIERIRFATSHPRYFTGARACDSCLAPPPAAPARMPRCPSAVALGGCAFPCSFPWLLACPWHLACPCLHHTR
jgi:hypothetical protein